jgi:hypothetical protein
MRRAKHSRERVRPTYPGPSNYSEPGSERENRALRGAVHKCIRQELEGFSAILGRSSSATKMGTPHRRQGTRWSITIAPQSNMTSNPYIERTRPGKPAQASYGKRGTTASTSVQLPLLADRHRSSTPKQYSAHRRNWAKFPRTKVARSAPSPLRCGCVVGTHGARMFPSWTPRADAPVPIAGHVGWTVGSAAPRTPGRAALEVYVHSPLWPAESTPSSSPTPTPAAKA